MCHIMILSTYLHQILNLLHFKFPIHQLHLPLSVMATLLSKASVTPRISDRRHPIHAGLRANSLKCYAQNPTPSNGSSSSPAKQESEPENALLKLAWYGSEMLGIAASFFRSPPPGSAAESAADSLLAVDESGAVDRTALVATIKDDFQRSYFVTGNLTLGAYEEKCEFADPAGSFKGLQRFKRNCTNFGSLIEKCNMKLMKWEDFEDKGVGHWRFSCILSFPWRPILSATGYTEYFFDAQSGKVCRHVEHWNVPKMTLLKQILKPSRRIRP